MNTSVPAQSVLYNDRLAKEWADWVETPNPAGSREQDLFPEIKNWITLTKPNNLIDIGCGQGALSTLVPPQVQYCGVDISAPLLLRANELYKGDNKNFTLGNAYALPFVGQIFDAAISFWVWSHLEDPEKAAIEMSRILKPDGSFIVVTANPETYDVRRGFYSTYEERDGYLIGDFDLGNGKKLSSTSLYLHSMERFTEALKLAGLSVQNTKKAGMLDEYTNGLYVIFTGNKN